MKDANKTEIVKKLWYLFEERNWREAENLFRPDAKMTWLTSNERFNSSKSIINVNETYPEGWHIRIIEINELLDGRVLSIVKVEQTPDIFFATSLFSFENGKISKIEEYWATFESPPDWRNSEKLIDYERI